jgi:molybdenum ABC transporter molybdate-binding protein
MPKPTWAQDWSVGIRVWIERHGEAVLGDGRADLLGAIARHQSITAAARAIGMSYRRAWTLIQEINSAAGENLIEAAVGGVKGGGARLTDRGRFALEVYQRLRGTLQRGAAAALRRAANPDESAIPCVHLAAAISLQDVVGELLAEYALRRPTVRVRPVYGASNELAEQILSGTSVDVFISANRDQIDRLSSSGMIRRGSRVVLARNGLAAVASKDFRGNVRRPTDLRESGAKHVIVADPDCPLGKCTADFLKSKGAYDALRPKFVQVDNSRAVVSAIRRSRASLGLIFSSDISNAPGLRTLFQVPANKTSASYEGAVTSNSSSASEAAALLDFLGSEKVQACFRRCGFFTART